MKKEIDLKITIFEEDIEGYELSYAGNVEIQDDKYRVPYYARFKKHTVEGAGLGFCHNNLIETVADAVAKRLRGMDLFNKEEA